MLHNDLLSQTWLVVLVWAQLSKISVGFSFLTTKYYRANSSQVLGLVSNSNDMRSSPWSLIVACFVLWPSYKLAGNVNLDLKLPLGIARFLTFEFSLQGCKQVWNSINFWVNDKEKLNLNIKRTVWRHAADKSYNSVLAAQKFSQK